MAKEHDRTATTGGFLPPDRPRDSGGPQLPLAVRGRTVPDFLYRMPSVFEGKGRHHPGAKPVIPAIPAE